MVSSRLTVDLPELHRRQAEIYADSGRFNAVCCGRRFGKTKQLVTLACDAAAKGQKVGVFAPEYKQLSEPYTEILWTLRNIIKSSNKTEGAIRTTMGGSVDFWTLTDNQLAGRGREYDLILIDEGAFTKNGQMLDVWRKSIRPTMVTRPGSRAWVFSTPNGTDGANFFYKICHDPEMNFKVQHAPSRDSPYVLPEELERERQTNHPQIFEQEFEAKFIDWSGDAFFQLSHVLVDGKPVPVPTICDTVYAVVDSAVKDGVEHDGTAVQINAASKHIGHPLVMLDWDIVSIKGAMLEDWLPSVFAKLDAYTKSMRVRFGSIGVFVEDKASGSILIQQANNRGWQVHAIDSKLTAAGKSERAIDISGYWVQGRFKVSQPAFDKVVLYKGETKNHWLSQISGFRLGDKDNRRPDDLLDTMCYSLAIGLGNDEGY